jgi:hypothetical protein
MNSPVARLARSTAVHLLFAFVAMGSWTVFTNRAHPMPAPRLAGMIQGGFSACVALFLMRMIGLLSLRLDGIVAGSGHRHLRRLYKPAGRGQLRGALQPLALESRDALKSW